MTLEIILTILGVLTALVGIWDLYTGAVVWGIIFVLGGAWAVWLGVVYIIQIRRSRKSGDKPSGSGEKGGAAAEAKPPKQEKKSGGKTAAGEKSESSGNEPENGPEAAKEQTAQAAAEKQDMYEDYGMSSVENAVYSDEVVDYESSSSDEPAETEVVTDRMIFEEFIAEQFTTTSQPDSQPAEEINPEVIIADPDPVVDYAEAEFVEEETKIVD